MGRRTVFFVSDQTGVTAETMGHSLLVQFEGQEFRPVTLPFVSTAEKAAEAVQRIDATARDEGLRPIVFCTLVEDDIRAIVRGANGLFLDFFAFSASSAAEGDLGARQRPGAATVVAIRPINATLRRRQRWLGRRFDHADVILVGVSRSGKTPTCLYMALQYGIFAANYPLTDEELETGSVPKVLLAHRRKLYGLTIEPDRLQQIRQERRPDSRYASAQQVQFEVRSALALFERQGIPYVETTSCSIEEIASRILDGLNLERRVRP
jgi:regulator of PEP synthase PpsR (kinase-PPPase family)